MIINIINKNIRKLTAVTLLLALLYSIIAPAAALATEEVKTRAMWNAVLNADLSAFSEEVTPYAHVEPREEQTPTQPESIANISFLK